MVEEFHRRGILSLFEGLEEPWQLELAEKCRVDMVQGYVLARPEIAPANFGAFQRVAAVSQPANGAGTAPQPAQVQAPAKPRQAPKRATFGHRGLS
jgi:EAL domain-containing protein (putative c-di-GMP-specific phosphodiesterase class I)